MLTPQPLQVFRDCKVKISQNDTTQIFVGFFFVLQYFATSDASQNLCNAKKVWALRLRI